MTLDSLKANYHIMKILLMLLLFLASFKQECLATPKLHDVKALYAFGDSYVDTGNANHEMGNLAWEKPYGISWPSYANGRFSNGHIQTDYIAQFLNLTSPTPFNQILDNITYNGINYAVGSSGVTYANGKPTLNVQVNSFEENLKKGIINKSNLHKSIAFVGTGVNDYTSYKGQNKTILALLDIVVDGITWNVFRLFKMGIHNVVVSNLAPMSCFPQYTSSNNYTHCLDNTTLVYETQNLHNTKLEIAMATLNNKVKRLRILLLDQSKAFQHLLDFAPTFGFDDIVLPCCKGTIDDNVLECGKNDKQGNPLYSLCIDAEKALFWDAWHLTERGCKAIVQLYILEVGYTKFGDSFKSWL